MNVVQRARARLANLAEKPKRPAGWFNVVRNDASGPTRVDIYDEIGGGGWYSEGVGAADFVATLASIEGDLEIHINSPGGDVFEGLAIYNSIAQRPGNVTTVVDGHACSAASFIAQAGKIRIIAPGAMMMIHDASGLCIGNSADMRELAELLDKVSDNIASIYAEHSGTPDGWRQAMQAETWYTADEAVAAGLADRLAERPNVSALAAAAKFDLSAYLHAPRIAAEAPASATPAEPEPAVPVSVQDAEPAPLDNKALPVHHTATEDSLWDGPAAVAAMPNDDEVLEYCHAWQSVDAASRPHKEGDGDADDQKGSYKFPHHRTKGGPANTHACSNGLARLEGSTIPDGDKAGVRAHLQAHLDDAHKGGAGTDNHAGLPAWLTNKAAPLPAWLTNDAEEAK